MSWKENDIFCGNQGLVNNVFLARNHLCSQRPLFLPRAHFLFCCALYRENANILYSRFAGAEESLPFLGLHISPTAAYCILAFHS